MAEEHVPLHCIAYGEEVEPTSGRSLGYKILAPTSNDAWNAEVEQLARRLQATPFPAYWEPVDLFCSVLLADGQRLVGVARYGLTDHSSPQRQGGLEFIGVVAPGNLGPSAALALYAWLKQQRAQTEELAEFAGSQNLATVLNTVEAAEPVHSGMVLPIRSWQDSVLVFRAQSPSSANENLALLVESASSGWQWIPLCGSDFPLSTYAERGPLIAWSIQGADVVVRWDRPATSPVEEESSSRQSGLVVGLALLFVLLLAGNLWALLTLPDRLPTATPTPQASKQPPPREVVRTIDTREPFIRALADYLNARNLSKDLGKPSLLDRYEKLVRRHPELEVDGDQERAAIGLLTVLVECEPDRVAKLVEESIADKGYDPKLVDLVRARVREELVEDMTK